MNPSRFSVGSSLGTLQDLGADVGPVAGHVRRRIQPSDAHLARALRFGEHHVRRLAPRVHVAEDARAELARRAVHERHAEAHARGGPLSRDEDGDAARSAAAARRASEPRGVARRIVGIDLDRALCGGRQLVQRRDSSAGTRSATWAPPVGVSTADSTAPSRRRLAARHGSGARARANRSVTRSKPGLVGCSSLAHHFS